MPPEINPITAAGREGRRRLYAAPEIIRGNAPATKEPLLSLPGPLFERRPPAGRLRRAVSGGSSGGVWCGGEEGRCFW